MVKKPDEGTKKNTWRRMHKKRLQREVILDIVEHGLSEREAEAKYRLRKGSVMGWFREEKFRDEVTCVMEAANWVTRVHAAYGACIAVKRLVALTECEKEETRRKACMDIIAMLLQDRSGKVMACAATSVSPPLSEKVASRLLAVLAEEEGLADDQPDEQCESSSQR